MVYRWLDYRIIAQVIISALLYTSAFVYPACCYWAVFICFIPFFCVVLSASFSRIGYLVFWAVVLLTLQWVPLIQIIIKQGNHPLKYCIPMICVLLVAAGGSAVGFLSLMVNKYIHFLYARVVLHTIAWWLFFEWIYRYLFVSFGYTLSYPLLPLAIMANLLWLCPFVSTAFLTFWLLLAQVAITSFYCYGNKRLLIIALVGYAPFFVGLLLPTNNLKQTMNVKYGIPPPYSGYMLDDAQEIAKCIIDARNYDYLIFPESSFCYDCLSDPAIIQLWQEYVSENQTVIIGTHVKQANQWRVTACCLTQQNVAWHYKSFLLPFAEYVPTWAPDCFKKIFLQERETFDPALIQTPDQDQYTMLICAELFLSKDCWRQMVHGSLPIIMLVSNSWCAGTWLQDLMLLFARFKSIEWRRVIMYCGSDVTDFG